MKQHHSRAHAGRHPAPPTAKQHAADRAPIFIGIAALASVLLLAIWLIPRQSAPGPSASAERAQASAASAWRVGMLRPDGLRIVVTGRNDASKVLDPQRFSQPEVRHGYWVARQIPALLNKLYC